MDNLASRRLQTPAFLLTNLMHSAAAAGRTDALRECVRRLERVKQYFHVGGQLLVGENKYINK
jgi:hypothetical protein